MQAAGSRGQEEQSRASSGAEGWHVRFTKDGVGGMTEQLVAFLIIMMALVAVLPALLSAEIDRREARQFSLLQEEAYYLAQRVASAPQLRAGLEDGLGVERLSEASLLEVIGTYAPSHPGAARILSLAQNGSVVAAASWGAPYTQGPTAGGSFPALLIAASGEGTAGLVGVALWGF